MKHLFILFVTICISSSCIAQGLWTQKAAYPSRTSTNSIRFSIQSLGYIYTGDSSNNFFAYDPIANTWTAKADFPGPARTGAVGFATDSFGYIGTGSVYYTNQNDFYQYDPTTNSWSSIASYPDSLEYLFAFGIGSAGYVLSNKSDTLGARCFTYSPSANQWTRIAHTPQYMYAGFATSVNGKGYCFDGSLDSIFQYDPAVNTWSTVGSFTYGYSTSSFVINNKIYICYTNAIGGAHAGMKVFDVTTHTWSLINVFPYPSGPCNQLNPYIGLSIGNKGYLGGQNSCIGNTYWEYDTAYNFVISTVAPDTICQNDSFSVSLSSNLPFTGTNQFYVKVSNNNASGVTTYTDTVAGSSSGSYTFKLPSAAYMPFSNNATTVSVYSTSPANETDYNATPFVIKKGPSYYQLAASYLSCGGSAMLLYRYNVPGQSYEWTSSPPGVSDSTFVLSITPTLPLTYIYTTDINNATGCSLKDSTVIILNTHPLSNISDSSYGICPGTSVTLGGPATADCSYTWTGSGGFTSSSVNPTLSPPASGVYRVVVKDSLTQCSTDVNIAVTVKQPPAQTICYVTVDSASTHNIIIWEKLDKYATDSFIIYRETSTNNYTVIGTVPRDSLSEYHDYGANPNVTAYRYKIATTDTCTNPSVLSPYHNTIHLQYLGTGNLIWNVYEIENDTVTPVSSFDVYWDTLANGNWQVMLNVPGNQYTATDVNYYMHTNAKYRIVANWSYSCTPARGSNNEVLSNIIQLAPTGLTSLASGQSISIYPNPALNELVIGCGAAQVQEVSIISADGKLVSTVMSPANNKIDVSLLASGIYIAEVKVNNTIQRVKWVKM